MEPPFSQAAATALVNIGLAWSVGALASLFWLRKSAAPWRKPVCRQLSVAMTAGLVVCAIGVVLSLWTSAAIMADVPWLEVGAAFFDVLASTHYGHAGIAALGALALAIGVHRRLRHGHGGMRHLAAVAALLLLVAAARVGIGHAFEHGPLSVAVLMEFLHVVFMSAWAGSVFVAGWVALPAMGRIEPRPRKERTAYLASLSDWAAAMLAGILATGAYNAYRVLGSPRDLIDDGYGRILMFKLCFVLIAIALGGFNRFYGLRREGMRIVIAVLRIESVAFLFVLGASAVLVNSTPPG